MNIVKTVTPLIYLCVCPARAHMWQEWGSDRDGYRRIGREERKRPQQQECAIQSYFQASSLSFGQLPSLYLYLCWPIYIINAVDGSGQHLEYHLSSETWFLINFRRNMLQQLDFQRSHFPYLLRKDSCCPVTKLQASLRALSSEWINCCLLTSRPPL